jgi:hypothetical protein
LDLVSPVEIVRSGGNQAQLLGGPVVPGHSDASRGFDGPISVEAMGKS